MKQTKTWCDRCKEEFQFGERGHEVMFIKDSIIVSVSLGQHPSSISELCNACFIDIVATGDIAGVSKRS